MNNEQDITVVLEAVAKGDREAAEQLLPLVYGELQKLARYRMNRLPPGQTLQPTALVHEAYLKVTRKGGAEFDGRGHFFAAAAQAMRDIIIDKARHKAAKKEGGDLIRVDFEYVDVPIAEPGNDVLALNEALKKLEADDPRKGQIVNLRYFAGMTVQETADCLSVSIGTVEREWRYIKAWMAKELASE